MLNLPPAVRIWLCTQPTDMRKSFDTLAALVRQSLGHDPLSGSLFVFVGRRADRLKILYWDRDGYALYFSRSPLPYHRDGAPNGALGQKHIGLYVYRRDFLLSFAQLAPTPLEQAEQLEQLRALEWGFRIKVTEVEAASIEVDTPRDLERARAQLAALR